MKQMLKRKDGSYSQRGFWDNIRAAAKRNKAAGKAGKEPTAAMLNQEKKIKKKLQAGDTVKSRISPSPIHPSMHMNKKTSKMKKAKTGGFIKDMLNKPEKSKTKTTGGGYVTKKVTKTYSGPDVYGTKEKIKSRRTVKSILKGAEPGTVTKTKNVTKYSNRTGIAPRGKYGKSIKQRK